MSKQSSKSTDSEALGKIVSLLERIAGQLDRIELQLEDLRDDDKPSLEIEEFELTHRPVPSTEPTPQ